MLKAGSLFYAVAISLIFAVISSSFVLSGYVNRIQLYDSIINDHLHLNASSAFNLLMDKNNQVKPGEEIFLDLYDNGDDSVMMIRMNWGVFEAGVVKAFQGKKSVIKTAIYGYKPDPAEQKALYLTDQNRPLSLCGNTIIKGTCYLPQTGVKRAYIEGQSFSGIRLIEGTVKQSTNQLPPVNKKLIEEFLSVIGKRNNSKDSLIYYSDSITSAVIRRSFAESTINIHSDQAIQLENISLSGNIIISSNKSISVGSKAQLNDVLIYAPFVSVADSFSGNIQVFTSDSVIIGENCSLEYPSSISLVKSKQSTAESFIAIGEKSKISGVVLLYQEGTAQKQPLLSIAKDVEITGMVYSSGLTELKGAIYGSLICSRLVLKTPSSVYENHLLNATIDAGKLPKHYVGSVLVESGKEKGIVKWVY